MPNRVLRDWTTSETIDKLSLGAEVFFTRLIMKADDYGNYTANTKLLKAALFPLREHNDAQIEVWVDECLEAGVVKKYNVSGKVFLNIPNFGQRLRAMKSQFPDIGQSDDSHVTVNGRPETKRNEVETETKQKLNEPDFLAFENWSNDIISGNDFVFQQQWQNEFPNWGGGPEKFAEIVRDHLDLLNRYPKMNPNTQGRFRASVIKHFREYKSKPNGTGNRKGLDVNAELQLIANHIKGGK